MAQMISDEREFFEQLVYHSTDGRRFTQQSPVMPDVWIYYGMNPGQPLDLLMEPNWHYTPANVAKLLRERLKADARKALFEHYRIPDADGLAPAIACNQNVVAVRLYFDQLLRAVLPMCAWWRNSIDRPPATPIRRSRKKKPAPAKTVTLTSRLEQRNIVGQIVKALDDNTHDQLSADVIWLARVGGLLAHLSSEAGRAELSQLSTPHERVTYLHALKKDHERLATAFVRLCQGMQSVPADQDLPLYSVNRNRATTGSIHESVNAIKGDAATLVFTTRGRSVCWAVVDSGIDATHIAFRKLRPDPAQGGEERPFPQPFAGEPAAPQRRRRGIAPAKSSGARNNTRVRATYDFVHVRQLLGAEPKDVDSDRMRQRFPALEKKENRDTLKKLLAEQTEYVVDWERFEPFLQVPHDEHYRPPENQHGTHVAGIIGADWKPPKRNERHRAPSQGKAMAGVAPAIEFFDIRVLDEDGNGTEFAIMSALQFIRDLNNRRDYVEIHGANLSFSIPHDVANYACGRTPVCEEAERLVSSGVVVVAAAGNSGRARYVTPSGVDDDGFRTVSITDPGNAASVITVGSTHRSDPHTYGVSYFSSRGPTGDGRIKPDLVAPGEKIRSTVPGDRDGLLDGTSMAAPHVSGAAALLISRHPEFIGQPARVKQILCGAATDLGRERYFQGAGLLDILRALQSI